MKTDKRKDIITCVGLTKYGMNAKMCFAIMILFVVIGIAFELMYVLGAEVIIWSGAFDFGALFLYSAAMYPAQILMSLDLCGMVQASPLKRTIQTGGMAFASLCSNLVALAILLLVRGLAACLMPSERAAFVWADLPVVGIMGLALSIMGGLMYKFYVLSILVMAVAILTLGFGGPWSRMVQSGSPLMPDGGMPFPLAVVLCIIMICLGNLLQYFIARGLYRRPFSRGAFGSAAEKNFV